MTVRQQVSSYAKAIVLVLLLYVLSAFVSGSLAHQGYPASWSELGFRGALALFGALLFHSSNSGSLLNANPVKPFDLLFAGCLALGLVAAGISGALGVAASDPDLRSGELPPASVLLIRVILGAVGEEMLFVGFLYRSFRRCKASAAVATSAVGVLFVLLHWPSSVGGVVTRAVYILASCAIFERCRLISLNIGLHAIVNGAFLLVVLAADDRVPFAPFFASFGLIAAVVISIFVAVAAVRYGWTSQADRLPRG